MPNYAKLPTLHHGVGGLVCCGKRGRKENSPHHSLSLEMGTKALLHLLLSGWLELGSILSHRLLSGLGGEDAQLRKVANDPP